MRQVRDLAIHSADDLVNGRVKAQRYQHLYSSFAAFDAQQLEIIHRIIPEDVDRTLRLLVSMLETANFEMSIVTEGSAMIKLYEAIEDLKLEL